MADIEPFSNTVETLSNNRIGGVELDFPTMSKDTASTTTGVECLSLPFFEKNSDAEDDFFISSFFYALVCARRDCLGVCVEGGVAGNNVGFCYRSFFVWETCHGLVVFVLWAPRRVGSGQTLNTELLVFSISNAFKSPRVCDER